ncbi:DUF998 domain-containing protein [Thermodesulfobacteriota bacterium]
MNNINREQRLLVLGIAITVIYFLTLIILAALYPDYSHMRNYVSDLGRIEAPHHKFFNSVVIFLGLLYLLTGLGYYYSVKRITEKNVLAVFIGSFVAVLGIAYFFGGFYPLPDPRHGGYSIGLLHFFTPLLLVWAFWKLPDTRLFRFYQLMCFILIVTFILIQAGVFGLIDETNLGLFQRLGAISLYAWFTFTCYWLSRYRTEMPAQP